MKKNVTISIIVLFTIFGPTLQGCEKISSKPNYNISSKNILVNSYLKPHTQCIWKRMADSFKMHSHYNNPRVKRYIKKYLEKKADHLIKYSKQASPYLYHIVNMLEEQGMPYELALLPIVESEYKPHATSRIGAAGLWQFVPITGRTFGLKQDRWYDGRRDIDLATRAALEYLNLLHNKFNGDWLLALASYNAGYSKVISSIRKNKKLGKPTDYWSLSLPKETQHFVPKFLALVYLVQNASNFKIDLAYVSNQPYFSKIELPEQIGAKYAAKLADIELKEFNKLNPALRAQVTHPNGPHHIVLPVTKIAQFQKNYKIRKNTKKYYTVVKGDTLSRIAIRYNSTVNLIKRKNNIKSDLIKSGQTLLF